MSQQHPKSSTDFAYEDGVQDALADGINNNSYVEGTAEYVAYERGFQVGLDSKRSDGA